MDNADAGPQRYLLSLDYKIIILHHNPNWRQIAYQNWLRQTLDADLALFLLRTKILVIPTSRA